MNIRTELKVANPREEDCHLQPVVQASAGQTRVVWIHFSEVDQQRPVILLSRRRARISTNHSEGIASYAGLTTQQYLELCRLTALTQLRALAENPLLQPEDLECRSGPNCLFSWRDRYSEFAYVFENRNVCHGCVQFYMAVCAESEVLTLQRFITVSCATKRL